MTFITVQAGALYQGCTKSWVNQFMMSDDVVLRDLLEAGLIPLQGLTQQNAYGLSLNAQLHTHSPPLLFPLMLTLHRYNHACCLDSCSALVSMKKPIHPGIANVILLQI